jgi:hypothetical protein
MSLTGTVWVGEIHSPPTNTRNARTRMAPTLVWRVCLPYGWAADDPVGLKHAIGPRLAQLRRLRLRPFAVQGVTTPKVKNRTLRFVEKTYRL